MLKKLASTLLVAAAASTVLATGCTVHARYYDPYYHDYHPVAGEAVYYNQWEHDTHREHRDLNKRSKDEQKQYWDWRHSHNEQH